MISTPSFTPAPILRTRWLEESDPIIRNVELDASPAGRYDATQANPPRAQAALTTAEAQTDEAKRPLRAEDALGGDMDEYSSRLQARQSLLVELATRPAVIHLDSSPPNPFPPRRQDHHLQGPQFQASLTELLHALTESRVDRIRAALEGMGDHAENAPEFALKACIVPHVESMNLRGLKLLRDRFKHQPRTRTLDALMTAVYSELRTRRKVTELVRSLEFAAAGTMRSIRSVRDILNKCEIDPLGFDLRVREQIKPMNSKALSALDQGLAYVCTPESIEESQLLDILRREVQTAVQSLRAKPSRGVLLADHGAYELRPPRHMALTPAQRSVLTQQVGPLLVALQGVHSGFGSASPVIRILAAMPPLGEHRAVATCVHELVSAMDLSAVAALMRGLEIAKQNPYNLHDPILRIIQEELSHQRATASAAPVPAVTMAA